MEALRENMAYQDEQIAKSKLESREGFTKLQESLDDLKRIVEGKRKLLGHQLRREIGKVKQTMFIEMPQVDGHQGAITYPH